jgi:deoxyribonuclease-4
MERLLFGTAGAPPSSKPETTEGGIERVRELGLDCLEVEFVRGVRMSPQSATLVGEVAAKRGVKLTAHAPYFINLNAREPEKVRASKERILQTARIASLFGAVSIAFHSAYYFDDPPGKVYERVKQSLQEIREQLKAEGNHIWIKPEVMGKPSGFGNLEELLNLSTEVEGVAPCVDFAHGHARTGKSNSYAEFADVLKRIGERLGRRALENMHIHVSGIKYGEKGEIKHLMLRESDFRYGELLRALKDYEVKGLLICESPNQEEDALLLQQSYNKIS